MATKQNIIAEINEMSEIDPMLRDGLIAELSGYPEELSTEDIQRFDQFVANVQDLEVQTGQALIDVANASDMLEEKMIQTEEEQADKTLDILDNANENAEIVSVTK